jgi:hypothetical protein
VVIDHAPLPADRVHKDGNKNCGADGTAQVDAGQLVDLTGLDLEVGIFCAGGIQFIIVILFILRYNLSWTVGRTAAK